MNLPLGGLEFLLIFLIARVYHVRYFYDWKGRTGGKPSLFTASAQGTHPVCTKLLLCSLPPALF